MKRPGGSLFKVLIAAGIIFTSCTTLQEDRLVSTADDILESELQEVVQLIVPLDTEDSPASVQEARRKVTELEGRAIEDTVFAARLAAWSGRLFLIENEREMAQSRLERALELSPGQTSVAVLETRLMNETDERLQNIESSLRLLGAPPQLEIEKARVYMELSKYREAVAAFDTALPDLPPVYSETYRGVRDGAWELRNLRDTIAVSTAEIASQESITWNEAIMAVQNETSLINFVTGGQIWDTQKIFNELKKIEVIPPETFPASDFGSRVLRGGAAWFVWHLNAVYNSRPELVSVYSEKFTRLDGARSPIPDVPVDKPWFDSVLGCIEWEFMTLPDGIRFYPGRPVTGAEFLETIQAVE